LDDLKVGLPLTDPNEPWNIGLIDIAKKMGHPGQYVNSSILSMLEQHRVKHITPTTPLPGMPSHEQQSTPEQSTSEPTSPSGTTSEPTSPSGATALKIIQFGMDKDVPNLLTTMYQKGVFADTSSDDIHYRVCTWIDCHAEAPNYDYSKVAEALSRDVMGWVLKNREYNTDSLMCLIHKLSQNDGPSQMLELLFNAYVNTMEEMDLTIPEHAREVLTAIAVHRDMSLLLKTLWPNSTL
jgi:hypothetical protein